LSETFNKKLFVELACATNGRNEDAPLLESRVAFVAPDSRAKVSVCGGWSVSVALAVNATIWPTFTDWLEMGARIGGVLGSGTAFNVSAMLVVWLSNPHVPVIVTFDVQEGTVFEAVSISLVEPPVTGLAANVAATPSGRLVALKV